MLHCIDFPKTNLSINRFVHVKMGVVTDNYYNIWIRKFGRADSDPRITSWIRYFRIFWVPVTALRTTHDRTHNQC